RTRAGDELFRVDATLGRTWERRRQAKLNYPSCILRQLESLGKSLQAGSGITTDVRLVMSIRHGKAVLNVGDSCINGALDLARRCDPDPTGRQLLLSELSDDEIGRAHV